MATAKTEIETKLKKDTLAKAHETCERISQRLLGWYEVMNNTGNVRIPLKEIYNATFSQCMIDRGFTPKTVKPE